MQSNNLVQNRQGKPLILKTYFPRVEKTKIYTGRIYEQDNNTFDIEVTAGTTRGETMDSRKLVHEIIVRSSREASVSKLTRYLNWKFRPYQRSGDCRIIPVRSGGSITHVKNNLEWIKSILEVDFDYHVGSANCLRSEHKMQMRKYRKSQCDGYGEI